MEEDSLMEPGGSGGAGAAAGGLASAEPGGARCRRVFQGRVFQQRHPAHCFDALIYRDGYYERLSDELQSGENRSDRRNRAHYIRLPQRAV